MIITGLWGTGPTEIFASAADGTVLRCDGNSWKPLVRDSSAVLSAVWGTSSRDVYAVGSGGTVLRFDGSAWSRVGGAGTSTLAAVWGTSGSALHAVGDAGIVLAGKRGGGARLVISSFPARRISAGVPIVIEAQVVDAAGRPVESSADSVTLTIASGPAGATLTGTSSMRAVNGVARFTDASVRKAGTGYTLQVSAPGLFPARTPAFSVYVGPLWRYAFLTQPPESTRVGSTFAPAVSVEGQDSAGNRVPLSAAMAPIVTLATYPSGPSGPLARLFGGNAGLFVDGATVFHSLVVNRAGAGYSLAAVGPGLLPDTSRGFRATPGRPDTVVIAPDSALLAVVGESRTYSVVSVSDSFGNPVTGLTPTWTSSNPGILTVGAASGVLQAVASGQAAVGATVDRATAWSMVNVAVPGAAPVRTWSPMSGGTTVDLNSVWAWSASDVYAVGGSSVLRFDGTEWTDVLAQPPEVSCDAGLDGPSGFEFWSVRGSRRDTVLVGYFFICTDPVTQNHVPRGGVGIFTSGRLNIHDYTGWIDWSLGGFPGNPVLWAPHPGAFYYFAHYWGIAKLCSYESVGCQVLWPGDTEANHWIGAYGTSEEDIWAVGQSGYHEHWDGRRYVIEQIASRADLFGLWGAGPSAYFAVGVRGLILHYDGTAWTEMTSGTQSDLLGVWGTSASDVYAVGCGGTILHYDGAAWQPMTSGTGTCLRAVFGAPSGEVFVVGDGGTILKGTR